MLELVGQAESGFLKKATANSITNMRAINKLAKEHAKFVDSIKDLTVEGEDFTFTGYYVSQINQAKESVDSRVDDLNEGVNSTSDGNEMLGRAILDRVEKQREELVESFDQIADPELIKRFEEADKNFLDKENGIEARLAFYRQLAAYLNNLNEVELGDWEMGAAIMEDLTEQQKLVFEPLEKFTEKQQESAETFKTIADERMEETAERLFKEYQSLLLTELKKLIGFPVFADADRIMTMEEISELENKLDAVAENINEFKSKIDTLDTEDFELMLKSIGKVSEFSQTYFTPDMIREPVTVSLLSLEDLKSDRLNETIVWRARFAQLADFDKQKRIGNETEELGEIDLSEDALTLLFTATVDSEPGDVGRVDISGGWAPLQLLLRDESKVKSSGRSSYIYRDQVAVNAYKPLLYGLQLDVPKALPELDEWPRIFDLKGF